LLLSQQVSLQGLGESDFLVGVVAGDPSLLNGLAGISAPNSGRVGVAHLAPAELPATLQGWSALDMLIVNDVDTSLLSPAQRQALAHWVSLGGRLVVGGGPNAAQTMAGLTDLLPFSQIDMQTLDHPLPSLEDYANISLEDRGPYVAAVPRSPVPGSKVVVEAKKLPLIVSSQRDLGQVYYLAFDLGLAPLDTLTARPRFLPQLTGRFTPANAHFLERLNYTDIRSSLTLIPNQTLPTPGLIALYLLVYILAVGPINYLVLRYLKRREWAWASLPLIVLFFCGFGYFSGFRLRGGEPLLREITVLHSQPHSPLAEATSFIGIYSPSRTGYTLHLADTALVSRLSSDSSLNNELTVISGQSTTITDLQADIGGMPTVMAHSQTAPAQVTAALTFDTRNKRASGTVINQTGQPISHAHLVFEDTSLDLGTLPPGETAIDGRFTARNTYSNFYDIPTNGTPSETVDLVSRDLAVRAVINFDTYSTHHSNLNGLYLIGWQSGSPVEVSLADQASDKMADTLLLVGLPYVRN
jgi:hypothetical protein